LRANRHLGRYCPGVSPDPTDHLRLRKLVRILTLLLLSAVCAIGVPPTSDAAPTAREASAVFEVIQPASRAQLLRDAADLRLRAASLGITTSTKVNGRNIMVQIPASNDSARILENIGGADNVYFRQTLCYAALYSKKAASKADVNGSAPALPKSCAPSTQLAVTNLHGSAGSGTGIRFTVPATRALAAYPSTSPTTVDFKNETVLLPGINTANGFRYLLGPAEMTGTAVKKAVAHKTQLGRWVVTMRLTPAGTASWNALAKKYFHEVIGIELNGIVQSAPLVLPNTSIFRTFGGAIQISGSFTKAEAQTLANSFSWSRLAVPLRELSVRG
jgi:hypothetical protein